ncbi:MAG: hypothetical protein ACJ8AT_23415 [Hyalangium sp.]|uniref:hypothetical protein n=1 Tax=Hyalangium sp. TaxID=2028555 RepID=UPI0038998734
MKKKLLSAVVLGALSLVGCGGNDTTTPQTPSVPKFDTADNIRNYLEGKALVMEGTNIPSFPNGYDEDVNYGAATQCYQKVQITVSSGSFHVSSNLATLRDAPAVFNKGTCDHEAVSGVQNFDSTAVLIENVAADASCFDISVTYPGFKQVGRGKLSADGKQITLELYFEGKATGNTCKDGAVGSQTVTVNGQPLAGDAQQVYAVSAQ